MYYETTLKKDRKTLQGENEYATYSGWCGSEDFITV